MKTTTLTAFAASGLFSVLPLAGYGQDADVRDVELRLEDARQRLETAAREVAELSGQLATDDIRQFRRHMPVDARRAMIGINIGDSKSGDRYNGVNVHGVTPGGPAAEAGVKNGDLITAINGDSLLTDPAESPTRALIEKMQDVEPGDEVILEFQRGNTTRNAMVVTGELNHSGFAFAFGGDQLQIEPHTFIPDMEVLMRRRVFLDRWGDLELVALTPQLGEYFGTGEGLLVVRAPSGGGLELQDGDVIVSIDGRRPASPRHAIRILRSYRAGEVLNLEIVRKNRTQLLAIEVPDDRLGLTRAPVPPPVRPASPKTPPAVGT